MTTDPASVTDEWLAELERLADAATQGGWFVVRYGDGHSYVVHSDDERRVFFPPSPIGFSATAGSLGDPAQIKADMKFVAASRAAVPALCAKVKEQAAEIERLRKMVRGFLRCPEIADCAPDDKDPETDALEREARSALPEER